MNEQTLPAGEPKPFATGAASPRLRPAQEEILAYTGGYMGVSAVPGSGKTFTLSLLAAQLVARLAQAGRLDEREVLIVTFTNSAVENFRSRIAHFVRTLELLPGVGYRVRTLHGLAHDIVRERPGLVGLSESFDIIDERTANEIKRDAVLTYLRTHPDALAPFIEPQYLQNFRSIEKYVLDDAIDIANAVIRLAKEQRMEPHRLEANLRGQSGVWPLLDFGLRIYADYQRSLLLRGAVDFNDLIVLALQALDADPGYLHRLQDRWPYILEDEAQDSSSLQEEMLRRLTDSHHNWVRVGDPNQAINTTFTSADTRFLQRFLEAHPAGARTLPNSGRCARPIMEAANYLIEWSRRHPVLGGEIALSLPQMEPTPDGDPQPNPEPGNPPVFVFDRVLTPDSEVDVVVSSLKRWLPQNLNKTVAVLVPENSRGFHITEALQRAELPFDDSLLRSSSVIRAAAQALSLVLSYIAQPQVATHLERVWLEVWWPRKSSDFGGSLPGTLADLKAAAGPLTNGVHPKPGSPPKPNSTIQNPKSPIPEPVATFGAALRRIREPESLLFPVRSDWLDSLPWLETVDGFRPVVEEFRADLRRWTAAMVLPVDELLLTLGNDLFAEPADLALTHRLALLLAKLADENPGWRLPELAGELENVAQNRRRLLGFNEEGQGFEPKPGQVTVATMHAAKGLEWDRVYLLAVNNFGFPSGGPADKYRSERWYVRNGLNLLAEAEAQLRQLHMGSLDDHQPGQATEAARVALAAERLRLLYVGITRARRELILTYNTGRNPERDPNQPALAFTALKEFLASRPL
jgi:DNA helicase II / ATP-dependent DNA helicase PcrA